MGGISVTVDGLSKLVGAPSSSSVIQKNSFFGQSLSDRDDSSLRFPCNGYTPLQAYDQPTKASSSVIINKLNAKLDGLLVGPDPEVYDSPRPVFQETHATGNALIDAMNQYFDALSVEEVEEVVVRTIPPARVKPVTLGETVAECIKVIIPDLSVAVSVASLQDRFKYILGIEHKQGPPPPTFLQRVLPDAFDKQLDYCKFCEKHQTTGETRCAPFPSLGAIASQTMAALTCCRTDEQEVEFDLLDSGLRVADRQDNGLAVFGVKTL
eukprot:GHVH01016438.1.p1 GENE.GHVH01016438.1~~GHVH01016438.1.p1  ORF type:complete len:267 (-),score=34.79 GHVH01016438.1:67-867(-)